MTGPALRSGVYRGRVRHRRRAPVEHAFGSELFLLAIDLDEWDEVFAGRWLWSVDRPNVASLRREDLFGDPSVPLERALRDEVEARTGRRPDGRIVLVTSPRTLGVGFFPVRFHYCHDATDRIVAIVTEITNTPWGERHAYVHEVAPGEVGAARHRFVFAKRFHVSPFMDMDQEYAWTFSPPGGRLLVHMESRERGRTVFDATLRAERHPLDGRVLASCLLSSPFQTGKVLAAIYLQALRLERAGAPFFAHPAKRARVPSEPSTEPLP